MMLFLIFNVFIVTEEKDFIIVKYDGRLKREKLNIFYEYHTDDTVFSDFSN